MMQFRKQNPILSIGNGIIIDLPAPANLSYMWNFGSLLGLCLILQICTGIFLAMHYCADVTLAFASVDHIMRDVNYGYLLRYAHANGGSMFFICLYTHIGRGMYYGSYTKIEVWNVGVILFILTMATAFIGYVLPWGQMSFWGATVITNLLSAIPYAGTDIVQWVWGGFSVSNATLNRFFSLHYLFPFVLVALTVIHLICLHVKGSNNPLGIRSDLDKVAFHVYYTSKDWYGIVAFSVIFCALVYLAPNFLGDPENFIQANPLVTPVHIQPEWYFLFAYAILRSIPNKLGGVIAMFASLLVLFLLPYLHNSRLISLSFRPLSKIAFWIFVSNFFLLTWIGSQPVEEPFILIGQIASILYFAYFLVIFPLLSYLETRLLFPGQNI